MVTAYNGANGRIRTYAGRAQLISNIIHIFPYYVSICVSFHVFHSTCLLVSPTNVSFQCLLISPSNASNASFHVPSNDLCVLSSLSPIYLQYVHPYFLQPVSNPSLQMSSDHMSHSNMTSHHILIIFPLVTTSIATALLMHLCLSLQHHSSPRSNSWFQ